MKKKIRLSAAMITAIMLICVLFTGCGNKAVVTEPDTNVETDTEPYTNVETDTEPYTDVETDTGSVADADYEAVDINIGSLKGPTSMGLVYLMDLADKGETANNYTFTMTVAADELLPKMISGDLDIALVPANVASVLYNKTEGGISVIDINTLGVLYMVSGDDSIGSIADLSGKTLYLTGKGTTPDYVLQYLLTQNGLTTDDLTLEYKSEATEVAALLAENPDAIGLLPQPFVTAASMQNEALSVVLDMTEEWAAVQGESGSSLVTGVTVVRNEFLQQHEDAVSKFMEEHKKSAAYANENVESAAELVAANGIVEKAQVAAKAMPYCNIVYMDSDDMKQALSGYLEVLYEADASSVGSKLPDDEFYYIP
ncbi:MAG: ABC transporter substrate-binding protein [Lachnospiraceae bacterium]|nr:ABC transporter substrate-binding protein [Lachnospiraceae bacterium]